MQVGRWHHVAGAYDGVRVRPMSTARKRQRQCIRYPGAGPQT